MRLSRSGYAVIALGALTVGAVVLVLRPGFDRRRPPSTPPESVSAPALYASHCAVCHGPTGKGDGSGSRIILQSMPDFTDPVAMGKVTDRFLFEIIKKGSSQFGRSNAMPSWGMTLSDDQIQAVVAYIRTLAPGARPASGERKETP